MSCSGVAGEERLEDANDELERAAEAAIEGAGAGEVAVEAEKDAAKLRAVRCPLSRLLSSSSRNCALAAVARAGDGARTAEPCAWADERAATGEAAAATGCAVYDGASVCRSGGDGGTRIWKLSKSSSVSLSLLYAKKDERTPLGVVVAAAAVAEDDGTGPRAGEGAADAAAERAVCASA